MSLVTATVRRVWAESARFTGVVLEVSPEVAQAYRVPGQYVVVHVDGTRTFLALCSAPGEHAALELLLAPAAAALLKPAQDEEWQIEPPQGPGFEIDAAHGRDAVLLGVGSGVGPLRALLESMRNQRSRYRGITLYAGAPREVDHVYRGFEAAWAADDIHVHRTVSKPFVQDVLRSHAPALDKTEAFVCGHRAMVQGVTDALVALGLKAHRVHQNY